MLLETYFSSLPLGLFQLGVEPGLPAWPKQFPNYRSLLHGVSTLMALDLGCGDQENSRNLRLLTPDFRKTYTICHM